MTDLMPELIIRAKRFIQSDLPHEFSEAEAQVLRKFFTNLRGRVFLIHTLPENMITVLLAMYSRIKNARGLRGIFVDNFLPQVLANLVDECKKKFNGDSVEFLKANGIKNLHRFAGYSGETAAVFQEFSQNFNLDLAYLEKLADSEKVRTFLQTWLDQYGHNSIARTGAVHLCFEGISILAAKSIEWCRPGAGYIELSTRYVDMSGKGVYPIEEELELFGLKKEKAAFLAQWLFEQYRLLQGENFTGLLPQFFKEKYGAVIPEEKLAMGIMGETCDVLGNLLPASTLVSVGTTLSGEALSVLIKHLKMDGTPENFALVDEIIKEIRKIGADQFIYNMDIATWQKNGWGYLRTTLKNRHELLPRDQVEGILLRAMTNREGFEMCRYWDEVIEKLNQIPRGTYDKLPREFEAVTASFTGQMTFRGWRDLHRMGFCAHRRSYLTPEIGFYQYDKPAPDILHLVFNGAWLKCQEIYHEMKTLDVPPEMAQYPLALGNLVKFWLSANLRQMEFCDWQRSKPAVNHEVRQTFLSFEMALRTAYPWWEKISRANVTPAYIFARGSEIPLPQNTEFTEWKELLIT